MLFQFLKKVSFFLELIYKLYFFSASHSTPTSPLVLLSSQTTCDIISNNSRATAFANFYPTWLRKLYCTGSVLWTCVSWLPPGYSTKLTCFVIFFYVPLLDNIVCECDRSGHTVSSILLILSPRCYRSRLSCRLCQINFDSENTEEQKGHSVKKIKIEKSCARGWIYNIT